MALGRVLKLRIPGTVSLKIHKIRKKNTNFFETFFESLKIEIWKTFLKIWTNWVKFWKYQNWKTKNLNFMKSLTFLSLEKKFAIILLKISKFCIISWNLIFFRIFRILPNLLRFSRTLHFLWENIFEISINVEIWKKIFIFFIIFLIISWNLKIWYNISIFWYEMSIFCEDSSSTLMVLGRALKFRIPDISMKIQKIIKKNEKFLPNFNINRNLEVPLKVWKIWKFGKVLEKEIR